MEFSHSKHLQIQFPNSRWNPQNMLSYYTVSFNQQLFQWKLFTQRFMDFFKCNLNVPFTSIVIWVEAEITDMGVSKPGRGPHVSVRLRITGGKWEMGDFKPKIKSHKNQFNQWATDPPHLCIPERKCGPHKYRSRLTHSHAHTYKGVDSFQSSHFRGFLPTQLQI